MGGKLGVVDFSKHGAVKPILDQGKLNLTLSGVKNCATQKHKHTQKQLVGQIAASSSN